MTEQRPTFREVRKQYHITLNMLIEDAQIDPSAVLLLGTWAVGEAGIVSRLLESLSRLTGKEYHRDLLTLELYVFSDSPTQAHGQ